MPLSTHYSERGLIRGLRAANGKFYLSASPDTDSESTYRLTNADNHFSWYRNVRNACSQKKSMIFGDCLEPPVGFEPTTC